jgi:bloom syndrome protein
MTRHNLASHLSWLLTHAVTPPVGVSATASTHATAAEPKISENLGEEREQEASRTRPNEVPARRTTQTTSSGRDFARSAVLRVVEEALPDIAEVLATETMGKLSSASRSTRPTLMSQQLATPASTIASSRGGLTDRYSRFLRGRTQILIPKLFLTDVLV